MDKRKKRILKFRAKDYLGDWYYGVISADGKHIVKLHVDPKGIQRELYQAIDPNTIGQFTGLLDKNGKEIYEDDLVEHQQGTFKDYFIVTYCDKYPGYYRKYINAHYKDNYSILSGFDDYAVVGNIYDTPITKNDGTNN